MKNIILLGAGEHSRVLLDIINQLNLPIVGVCDPSLERNKQKSWKNIEVFPEESIVPNENGWMLLFFEYFSHRRNVKHFESWVGW